MPWPLSVCIALGQNVGRCEPKNPTFWSERSLILLRFFLDLLCGKQRFPAYRRLKPDEQAPSCRTANLPTLGVVLVIRHEAPAVPQPIDTERNHRRFVMNAPLT